MNLNKLKLRGLNWHGQNLEDWIELWPNLKGVICNLAFSFLFEEMVENLVGVHGCCGGVCFWWVGVVVMVVRGCCCDGGWVWLFLVVVWWRRIHRWSFSPSCSSFQIQFVILIVFKRNYCVWVSLFWSV